MAKPSREADRQAKAKAAREALEAEGRRRARRNVAGVAVIALIVVGLAVWKAWPEKQPDLSLIGVTRAQAQCDPLVKKDYDGPANNHVDNGTPLTYADAPPAFGQHWGLPMQPNEYRSFYDVRDRPAKELLVHSLEHGYSVLWYDETAADDPVTKKLLQQVADKYPVGHHVVVAPWTSADGGAFPAGKHLALTHWTGGDQQQGVWEYCGKVSGSVIQEFVKDYPKSNSPEPSAA